MSVSGFPRAMAVKFQKRAGKLSSEDWRRVCSVDVDELVHVGDGDNDRKAAQEFGCIFIGVCDSADGPDGKWAGAPFTLVSDMHAACAKICELAGVPVQPDVAGRSFARHLLTAEDAEEEALPPQPAQHRRSRAQPRRRPSYLSAEAAFSQYPRCYGEGEGGMVLCAL